MSSSNMAVAKIPVSIRADTMETEIFIVDADFRRVAKGIGSLDEQLAPGLYDIKFKAGSAVEHVPLTLEPNAPRADIRGPRMRFETSAPLAETETEHETQGENARVLSQQVHEERGEGSQLFIFARDLSEGSASPMNGLSLCSGTGQMIVDLASRGVASGYQRFRSAGLTVKVNPGVYRLRVTGSGGTSIEQSVVASKDWQTQVFLTLSDCLPGDTNLFPDLTGASVFMSRLGNGFNPGDDDSRHVDLARQGLANRRNVMSRRDIWDMLWGKYRNPMLGIYGAHLLLLEPDPDMSLLEEVTNNLTELIGDHPDVGALRLYLARRKHEPIPPARFGLPPMLMSSWKVIIEATAEAPGLVARRSLSARIADRIWGQGPWLVWTTPADAPVQSMVMGIAPPSPAIEPALVGNLTSTVEQLGMRADLASVIEGLRLTPLESDLFSLIQQTTAPPRGRLAEARPSPPPRLDASIMVRSLGAPSSAVADAVEQLASKLKRVSP